MKKYGQQVVARAGQSKLTDLRSDGAHGHARTRGARLQEIAFLINYALEPCSFRGALPTQCWKEKLFEPGVKVYL